MSSLRGNLFYIWLLLLPFGFQLAAYTGFTEPDKVIAPFLLMMGLVTVLRSSPSRRSRVVLFMFLATALLVVKNISLLGSNAIYWPHMWEDAVKIGYFLVPLLCIDSMDIFRRVGWYVVYIAIVGCVSPFLVSIGLVTLPIEIPEEYRIGWLSRAKGLFLSTGNLAQYVAFAVAWVIVAPGIINKARKSLRVARWILLVAVALGLLGTQSRNIVLVLLISLMVLWSLRKLRPTASDKRAVIMLGAVAVFVPIFGVIALFSAEIINMLADTGGEVARSSALGRLVQFEVAWDVIKTHPFLGADAETYTKVGDIIDHIHNMWLELLATGGAVSATIMLAIVFRSFIGVRNAARIPEKSDEAIVVTVYFAAMLVAVMFYIGTDKMFWALFGIATALACIEPLAGTKIVDQKQVRTQPGVATRRVIVSRRSISKSVRPDNG